MEDRLKRFVDDNREAFDKFEPRPEVWESLEKKLGKQKKPRVIAFQPNMLWRYAAGIVLVLGFSYGLIQFGRHLGQTDRTPAQPLALEKIAPEMAEVETYYLSIINQKKELRKKFQPKADGPRKGLQRRNCPT